MKDSDATNAIVALLEANVGYRIALFNLISVGQLEDGTFALNSYQYVPELRDTKHEYERIFVNAREAAVAFERARAERLLGYDHERESPGEPQ